MHDYLMENRAVLTQRKDLLRLLDERRKALLPRPAIKRGKVSRVLIKKAS